MKRFRMVDGAEVTKAAEQEAVLQSKAMIAQARAGVRDSEMARFATVLSTTALLAIVTSIALPHYLIQATDADAADFYDLMWFRTIWPPAPICLALLLCFASYLPEVRQGILLICRWALGLLALAATAFAGMLPNGGALIVISWAMVVLATLGTKESALPRFALACAAGASAFVYIASLGEIELHAGVAVVLGGAWLFAVSTVLAAIAAQRPADVLPIAVAADKKSTK